MTNYGGRTVTATQSIDLPKQARPYKGKERPTGLDWGKPDPEAWSRAMEKYLTAEQRREKEQKRRAEAAKSRPVIRQCVSCGKDLVQRDNEDNQHFGRRLTCDKECSYVNRARKLRENNTHPCTTPGCDGTYSRSKFKLCLDCNNRRSKKATYQRKKEKTNV